MLTGLERAHPTLIAFSIECLGADEIATHDLEASCRADHRPYLIDSAFLRPQLDAVPGAKTPPISGSQRRRIARLTRGIEQELGPVELGVTREPTRIAELADDFLSFERGGWKGRAGSALACSPRTEGFYRSISSEAARLGRLELAVLQAGRRPIAISSSLIGRSGMFGFKTAFDERHAKLGPGVVLLSRYTADLLARGPGIIDSCCKPGQQPISRLRPGRGKFRDMRIALGGLPRQTLFRASVAGQGLCHRLVENCPIFERR